LSRLANDTTSAAEPSSTETESPAETPSDPEAANTDTSTNPESSSDPSNTDNASTPANTPESENPATGDSSTDSPSDTQTPSSDATATSEPSDPSPDTSGNDAPSTDSSDASTTANAEAARKFRRWLFPRSNFTTAALSSNTTTSSNSTIIDITNQTLSAEGKTISDWSFPEINFEGYNTTSDTELLTLVDSKEKFILTSCADENIYLADIALNGTLQQKSCAINWQEVDGSVIADGLDRILHYYNNTMSKLGVSRLRISNEKDIPLESVYVNLFGFNDETDVRDADMNDNGPDAEVFFLAYDEDDNTLFPIACSYEDAGLGSKLFLAKDAAAGAKLLASEDLIPIVTGGRVTECHALDIKQPYGEDGFEAWNPDATDEE
jgi:hypothetical protein